jgi:hypothetical protein
MKEVLSFNINPKARSTVRRYYDQWRADRGLPRRCDIEGCTFHSAELLWNGKPLDLILDHVNGNSNDNRAANLRYVCPNCDSQLQTRGGKNIGRIINESDRGFQVKNRNGQLDTLIAAKTARIQLNPL